MTERRVPCHARQFSDQMCCGRCGLQWDVKDDDPPDCLTNQQLSRQRGREQLDKLKEKVKEWQST